MKNYIKIHPWKIIEDRFDPELNPNSESLFSIGNGRMGQRANFPEAYSGESLQGSYIGGVYYPDKTRVGWWKNGYPEYFAKVLNSVNWIGIDLTIDGDKIDLSKVKIKEFYRELDMKEGILRRRCKFETKKGKTISISTERLYSLQNKDHCALIYKLECDKKVKIKLNTYLDFNISNSDSNYDEDFWTDRAEENNKKTSWVKATTKKTCFDVCASMLSEVSINESKSLNYKKRKKTGYVSHEYSTSIGKKDQLCLTKYVAICSSFYHSKKGLHKTAIKESKKNQKLGWTQIVDSQIQQWSKHWDNCDVSILGDDSAQQGIRFNIFQLMQTYSGEDARLNIGPKGFTGEKYGGSTYWDTEAYCLPFYMSTAPQSVAKNLLIYRHNHLEKAIDNAKLLGFKDGAALYPMVTMNGEECHNEWEITFEEIHRNGAIAYAIYDYIQYTGDKSYLSEYGIDVLIGIARFWAQRVNYSKAKRKYVILGVTGPNEYENNVNNNWYTNYIAKWCLEFASENLDSIESQSNDQYNEIVEKLNIKSDERELWRKISARMYEPVNKSRGIYLQQDGFLDKEDLTVEDLSSEDRPINQKWSWDRILRSPYIKQADVLQGLYFFEDHFDEATLENNFDYYEPKTVHESSLSPCVHSILAAKLGKEEKAYEMYLRTARLDLDDYNNDTEDGCHITSMAGTWLSIVKGFAGMRARNGQLSFKPFIPKQWDSYSFNILHKGNKLKIHIDQNQIEIKNYSAQLIHLNIGDKAYSIDGDSSVSAPTIE